jgi:hypothetical protein
VQRGRGHHEGAHAAASGGITQFLVEAGECNGRMDCLMVGLGGAAALTSTHQCLEEYVRQLHRPARDSTARLQQPSYGHG